MMEKLTWDKTWINDKCWYKFKKPGAAKFSDQTKRPKHEEDYIWNASACCDCDKDCAIGEYLKRCKCMKIFLDDLAVTCDEIEYMVNDLNYVKS